MQQPLTVTISLSLYLFVLFHTVLCAQVETEAFDVNTEVLSPTRARISWFGIGDEEGVSASRYRVLCTSPDSHAVEAITKEQSVEIDTFTPGRTYTCEVHPVWYNLVEGMEVLSANPAISEPFEMTFEGEVDPSFANLIISFTAKFLRSVGFLCSPNIFRIGESSPCLNNV